MQYIKDFFRTVVRELRSWTRNPLYFIAMVLLPALIIWYFAAMMEAGLPKDLPVGVVDQDNTSTTRALIRRLDGMQTSRVAGYFNTVTEARQAMQKDSIYGFIHFPKGTTDALLSQRQPKIGFYYTLTSIMAGSLVMRDMKTVSMLGSAAVGQATMQAKGFTPQQTMTFLQPIALDVHMIGNPWVNYNYYLSTMLVPACLMLLFFLITAYSLGMELKRKDGFAPSLPGKMLPYTVVFLSTMYLHEFYLFGYLGVPHPGGTGMILLLGLLAVLAAQGFAVFIFGLMPSMRLSMSVCSLWGVLSFSMVGTAFPVMSMDAALQMLANIFPMRHYFQIYTTCVFGGHSIDHAWFSVMALTIFAALPLLVWPRMHTIFTKYEYIE